jgi:hypothetical protein
VRAAVVIPTTGAVRGPAVLLRGLRCDAKGRVSFP